MFKVKRGRKRFFISEELVHKLPDYGTPSQYARCLGISRAAISRWMRVEFMPANAQQPVYDPFEAHFVIVRGDFLNWAEATGRYVRCVSEDYPGFIQPVNGKGGSI